MRFCSLLLMACSITFASSAVFGAEEPYLDFLQQLRERKYFDYALLYVDQWEGQPGVPEELRQSIPYQRAVTLLESAKTLQSRDAQKRQYDEAVGLLRDFVKQHPDHPNAADAQSEQARVLMDQASASISKAQSRDGGSSREGLLIEARGLIGEARRILEIAYERHEKIYESFPKFVPEENVAKREARDAAVDNYMRAPFELARCTFLEAQTYEPKSQSAAHLFAKASREFEAIQTKYPKTRIAVHAQLWQGKCLQEQGEIGKALGIYNEILRSPDPSLKSLRDQVLLFRMMCLTSDDRKDYQLAVDESAAWLKDPKSQKATSVGLGIAWQQAMALEKLSENRGESKTLRENYLKRALDDARYVGQYPNEYRDDALAMVRKIEVELKGRAGDPNDFDSALGVAQRLFNEMGQHEQDLADARSEGNPAAAIDSLRQNLDAHLRETARMFHLALRLADSKSDAAELNAARYKLSYVDYQLGHNYDAAVLAEYVARQQQSEEPESALDAAYLAMAAYVQSYYAEPREDLKRGDLGFILSMGEWITSEWPGSERANDVRMQMGLTYQEIGEFDKAAEWFAKVPDSADTFASAQLRAGTTYWNAYLQAGAKSAGDRPSAEMISEWHSQAQKHLETGIESSAKNVSASAELPEEVIRGKVALASILIERGNDAQAVQLLSGQPHPVTEAVVSKGQRPKTGIKSEEFASYVYQLLLRAQIGTGELDAARKTMATLEKVSEENSKALMSLYTDLGRSLKNELDRLKNLGDLRRLAQVRKTFENFLGEMLKRTEGQNYRTLVWIGETYYGLGEGLRDQHADASEYFAKASQAFQTIVAKSANDSSFADAQSLYAVKLRLVNCRRETGDYEGAFNLVADVLAEKPKYLNAQMEAAQVLEDWGNSRPTTAWRRYKDAFDGTTVERNGASIWGWGEIALRLEQLLNMGDENLDYVEKQMEARYHQGTSRHQYALMQPSPDEKVAQLEKGRQEIRAFAALTANMNDEWRGQFDRLYRTVQEDLNRFRTDGKVEPVTPLPTPVAMPAPRTAQVAEANPAAGPVPNQVASAPAGSSQPQPPKGPPIFELTLALLLALAIGGGVFYFGMVQGGRKKRASRSASAVAGTTRVRSRR